MSLITRCQVCHTAFRVHRTQLAARGGKVRCGKCSTVFDGVAGLVEEGVELLRLEPSPQLGLFDPSRRAKPSRLSPPQAAAALDPAPKLAAPGVDDVDAPLPEFLARDQSPRRSLLLWGVLVLLAAAALVAQATYRYRTEIAVIVPAARKPLLAICRVAQCEVPLPKRPELMSIESSDLQADPKSESVIVLNAVLRNRAPFPQEYPSLELTLTDDADRPVLRRVLGPRDYLESARAALAPQGITAGGEAAFRVNFHAGNTRATGYRLYLFFPQ
jgi:predicted Zn finger-like uncharacterized protein